MIGELNTDNPQSPLIYALHFVERTFNIPSSQHSIANPRPTTTQQHEWYTRAATICPCLVLKVSTPGHPHMCEYCALLQHVLIKSPTSDYPTFESPHPNEGTPTTYTNCVVFDLIHQITFAERWKNMQHDLASAQQSQLHPSLNSPQPGHSASPMQNYGVSPLSIQVPTPASILSVVSNFITLVLSPHTDVEMQNFLIANPLSPLCTMIHIAHPVLPLTMKNLHSLHNRTPLSISHLFHHLRIIATSPLIPCDRSLYVTIDNVVHILTLPSLSGVTTSSRLHIFLNPHDDLPYLRHIHEVDEKSRCRLESMTSLPETGPGSSQPQRRPMMRTMAHTPDLVTTFTFPTDSR